MQVTESGTTGTGEAVERLREWDPVPIAEDRAFDHFIDGF
jgi:hypothetical protein